MSKIEDPIPNFPKVSISALEADLNAEFSSLESGYNEDKARRMRLWKEYQFQMYGNEREGQSKIVDSTIFNVVEWMTPSLIKPFVETDNIVKIDPSSANLKDIVSAEYNRELIHYQLKKKLDTYTVLYDTFKTFLVGGKSYIKATWQKRDLESFEPVGRPKWTPVTPDAIRWDWTVKGGFMHSHVVTHEEDWPKGEVQKILGLPGVLKDKLQKILERKGRDAKTTRLRDEQQESTNWVGEHESHTNKGMDLFLRREHWTRYDMGDGVVCILAVFIDDELVQVVKNPYKFKRPPFVMGECIRDPLGNPAVGWAEILSDLQKYRSSILRMTSDNLNSQHNGIYEVDITAVDEVGMRLLQFAPQGSRIPIPTRKPGSINPLSPSPIAQQAFTIWELLEVASENRGGFTRYSQGLDSKSLNQTATGFVGITQKSEMRMWEIAKRFSEYALKPLVRMTIALNQQFLERQDIEIQFGINARGHSVYDDEGNEIQLDRKPGDLVSVGKEDIGGIFSSDLDIPFGNEREQQVNDLLRYAQYVSPFAQNDPSLQPLFKYIAIKLAEKMGLKDVKYQIQGEENGGRGITIPTGAQGSAQEASGFGAGSQVPGGQSGFPQPNY